MDINEADLKRQKILEILFFKACSNISSLKESRIDPLHEKDAVKYLSLTSMTDLLIIVDPLVHCKEVAYDKSNQSLHILELGVTAYGTFKYQKQVIERRSEENHRIAIVHSNKWMIALTAVLAIQALVTIIQALFSKGLLLFLTLICLLN